ncbi:MAG: hypothetical protein ACKO8I_11730 [Cyanobacteriota bacterium]
MSLPPLLLTTCGFDKTATAPVLAFQALVLAATAAGLWGVSRFRERTGLRYALMALGVLIFELPPRRCGTITASAGGPISTAMSAGC